MTHSAPVKPTDAAIKAYHAALKTFADHGAGHEGATETAFSQLLAATAKPHGWTLIPKKGMKAGGRHIVPDDTLQDGNFLPRGYWEAKDTDDELDAEIVKKRKKGYPLSNTIFEDTTRAVLYQNGAEADRFDLADPAAVADLLTRFYAFAEPDIEGFEEAVEELQPVRPGISHRPVPGHRGHAVRHPVRPEPGGRPGLHRPAGRAGGPGERRDGPDRERVTDRVRRVRRVSSGECGVRTRGAVLPAGRCQERGTGR